MRSSLPGEGIEAVLEAIPADLKQVAELCSVPLWLDDELARDILSKHPNGNGHVPSSVAELRRLPFVGPYEGAKWRYSATARDALVERLRSRNGLFQEMNAFLADRFEDRLTRFAERERRRDLQILRWHKSYHLAAAGQAELALSIIDIIVEEGARRESAADLKSAVDLCEDPYTSLQDYQVDAEYYRGRYQYSVRNFGQATTHFQAVLKARRGDLKEAIASHLIAVVWASKRATEDLTAQRGRERLEEAEGLARRSLSLGEQLKNDHHVAHVLNTLAGVLIDRGGRERVDEAERLLRRSLELLEEVGDSYGVAQVLNTLAGVLRRQGRREQLGEAERLLRRSLELEEGLGNSRGVAQVLNTLAGVLIDLRGPERLDEAERLLRRSLELEEGLGNSHGVAQVLNTLAGVLVDQGGRDRLDEAESLLRRSLELGAQLKADHHVAQVLNTLAGVLRHQGGRDRLDEAESLLQRSLELLEQLGDPHGVGQVLNTRGLVLVSLERFEDATEALKRALALAQQFGDENQQAVHLLSFSMLYERAGDADRASAYMDRVIEIQERTRSPGLPQSLRRRKRLRDR